MPDGTVLVVEEARTGRKKLALTSLRKYPVAKDFDSIAQTLLSNARSDNGDGLILAPQNPQDLLASNPEAQVAKAKEALDEAGVTGTDRTTTIATVRRGDLTAQQVAESHKPSADKNRSKDYWSTNEELAF